MSNGRRRSFSLLGRGLLIAGIGWLQYELWFSIGGVGHWWQQQQHIAIEQKQVAKLQKRNADLLLQIHDLKAGGGSVEEQARSYMGMIKNNETYYQVIEPKQDE